MPSWNDTASPGKHPWLPHLWHPMDFRGRDGCYQYLCARKCPVGIEIAVCLRSTVGEELSCTPDEAAASGVLGLPWGTKDGRYYLHFPPEHLVPDRSAPPAVTVVNHAVCFSQVCEQLGWSDRHAGDIQALARYLERGHFF